jgi:hypothetical protein
MATTWEQFLATIREEIKDNGATVRYSDSLLLGFTKDAIRDYSTFFPKIVVQEELCPDDVTPLAYCMPEEISEIIEVQCPLGTFLQERVDRLGRKVVVTDRLLFYAFDDDHVYFNAAPHDGDTPYITYARSHDVPCDVEDCTFTFSIKDADLELIKLYVQGKVQIRVRGDQSKLDRFKVTSGVRDDNPMDVEATDYMARYHEKIVQRIRGGTIQLFNPRKYVRSPVLQRYPF